MSDGNSYSQVLRASSIIGGANGINYVVSLIRVKIVAVLLGPSGVGLIGLFQSLALMPGISRSGTTIACALVLGFKQDVSAKYSFLLAVPAIAGAFILQLIDIGQTGFQTVWLSPLVLGFIISAVSGVFAIKLIMLFLHKKKLFVFSLYCWAVACLFFLTR